MNLDYSISCSCGREYIKETCRCLSIRISEHKQAVDTFNRGNALAVHIMEHLDHQIQWEQFHQKILAKLVPATSKEAIWTAVTLNTDPGLVINPTWNTILITSSKEETITSKNTPANTNIPTSGSTPPSDLTAPALLTS